MKRKRKVMKSKKMRKRVRARKKPKIKKVRIAKRSVKKVVRRRKVKAAKHARRVKIAKVKVVPIGEITETDRIEELLKKNEIDSYIKNKVGNGAMEIMEILAHGPQTDEALTEKVGMKINDVRRMLNVMNGQSIVRYDVNKDGKGWLIFKWRIDSEKLDEFAINLESLRDGKALALPENCNDFFLCKSCNEKKKEVLPFDTAFETDFRCGSCGKKLEVLNRSEAEAIFKQVPS